MRKILLVMASAMATLSIVAQEADFIANEVCYSDYTTFVGSSNLNDSIIAGWYWDMDNDSQYDDDFGRVVTHVFTQADTFLVGLKVVTTQGVEYEMDAYKGVTVRPLPNVNFHVDNLCAQGEAVFTDMSTIEYGSIDSYIWNFNNVDTAGIVTSATSVTWNCGPAMVYVTRLTATSDHGCSAFTTKTTEVFNVPKVGISAVNACIGDVVEFTNNTTIQGDSISAYIWDFGDNQGESFISPSHIYEAAGTYTVSLDVISSHNCKDSSAILLTIAPLPDLDIQYNPDSVVSVGEVVTITASGSFNSLAWWDGSTANSVTVNQEGSYSVEVTDNNQCKKSAVATVNYETASSNEVILSNILTPNGDGINDYLEIRNRQDYSSCTISIYNMWGDGVYSSTQYNNDWDGSFDSQDLDAGAYYFVISLDGITYTGTINILR